MIADFVHLDAPVIRVRVWSLGRLVAASAIMVAPARVYATDFYASPHGNDANAGTSPRAAWQTTSRVNSARFAAGDRILFEGGAAFDGGISALRHRAVRSLRGLRAWPTRRIASARRQRSSTARRPSAARRRWNVRAICTATSCPPVDYIAAGGGHTCALMVSGSMQCWGSNIGGELGDGTSIDRSRPIDVVDSAGPAFDAISLGGTAMGDGHTCAHRTDGSIACWGINFLGQVGDSTTTDRPSPTRVAGLDGVSIRRVAAGTQHSCALADDGSVYCWGFNGSGQVGDGTLENRPAPTRVTSLGASPVVEVVAGGLHTCSRHMDRTVRCWGANMYHQLGVDGSVTGPVVVAGLGDSPIVQLAAGAYHTCALRMDGAVLCWGSNGFGGQVGDSATEDRATPVVVNGLPRIVEVAAGWVHTCARAEDGTVSCWGSNSNGQIGDGTRTDRRTAVRVTSLADATQIATGSLHSCARIASGAIVCWGGNMWGQIGDGTLADRPVPTAVGGLH